MNDEPKYFQQLFVVTYSLFAIFIANRLGSIVFLCKK